MQARNLGSCNKFLEISDKNMRIFQRVCITRRSIHVPIWFWKTYARNSVLNYKCWPLEELESFEFTIWLYANNLIGYFFAWSSCRWARKLFHGWWRIEIIHTLATWQISRVSTLVEDKWGFLRNLFLKTVCWGAFYRQRRGNDKTGKVTQYNPPIQFSKIQRNAEGFP